MSRFRWLSFLGLTFLCGGAVFLTVRGWTGAGLAEVRAVPPGHQEIAWLSPATSGDAWERLVAALELLQEDKTNWAGGRSLRVNLDKAFLALSADLPEVSLHFDDAPDARLWIRWYKLTGENPSQRWIDKLRQRGRPPLVVIGGETSDRARHQALALEEVRDRWPGAAPLYFITTATAERYYPRDYQAGDIAHSKWPKLIEVYDRRTFRFCFTNTRIVEAVLEFLRQNPHVCSQRLAEPQVFAGLIAEGNALAGLGLLHATRVFQPYFLSTLAWADDGYSRDLAEIFLQVFAEQARTTTVPFMDNNSIDYSVGGFFEPNPREAMAVGLFLANNQRLRDQPQLLALPTGVQRVRRFLRTLCRRAPLDVRNVVAVTGDAVNFNNVYRDRDVAWNIQDMPVPLVFFSHRNPISSAAGFGQKDAGGRITNTATHDLLLNRDILEALVLAAFERGGLVRDADQLLDRLGHTRWHKGRILNDLALSGPDAGVPFFDGGGNRLPGTGEHVIWLRPLFEGSRNLPRATITVWRTAAEDPTRTWRTFSPPLHILYDQSSVEEASVHAGN